MNVAEMKCERADVLVVGGGIAGAVAAILAREGGLDVLLIDRSFFGAGGCTALASGTVYYYKPGDDLEEWLLHSGGTLVNRDLLVRATERTYDLVNRLESWGVKWVKQNGEIARAQGPGMSSPSNALMVGGGPKFAMALRTHALRIGVRVMDRTLGAELLTSDG